MIFHLKMLFKNPKSVHGASRYDLPKSARFFKPPCKYRLSTINSLKVQSKARSTLTVYAQQDYHSHHRQSRAQALVQGGPSQMTTFLFRITIAKQNICS